MVDVGYWMGDVGQSLSPTGVQLDWHIASSHHNAGFEVENTEPASLRVFSTMGQDVSSQVTFSGNGSSTVTADLSALPAGMYLVRAGIHTTKIRKQ